MNLDKILKLYDKEQRIELTYPDIERQVTPYIVRHISLSSSHPESWIIYSSLDDGNVDDVIGAEISFFEQLGHDLEWKYFSHDHPLDLKERLARQGFEIEDEEAVLVADLRTTPAKLLEPVTHDVRRITNPAGVEDVISVQEQIWGRSYEDMGEWLREGLQNSPEQISIYAVYVNGKPVSSGRLSFHEQSQFAGLWGGSTLPAYRKQGIYTALVAIRTQEAMQRGIRFLTIDASPMSRPILEKFGYELLTYTYPCKWKAGQRSTSL